MVQKRQNIIRSFYSIEYRSVLFGFSLFCIFTNKYIFCLHLLLLLDRKAHLSPYLKANLAFMRSITHSTPSVFYADQQGML